MKIVAFIFFIFGIINADSKYERALLYLDGEIGSTKEMRKIPRCPYDRCKGDVEFEYIRADKKTAYRLLKESAKEDTRSANKAFELIVKEIDYKSINYDDFLLEKIKKEYGINNKQEYDEDMRFFLNILIDSDEPSFQCNAAYMLYTSYTKGYFGVSKDAKKASISKSLALEKCSHDNYKYLALSRKSRDGQ